MQSSNEQRRRFRVMTDRRIVWSPVELLDSGMYFEGKVVDLSVSGVAFAADRPIFVGHRIALLLSSEDPPFQFAARGRVVRCRERDGEYICALHFEGLTDERQAALTRFVLAEAKRLGQGTEVALEPRWRGSATRSAGDAPASGGLAREAD